MARNDAKTEKLFDYLRESTLSVILGPNINNILLKVRGSSFLSWRLKYVGPILKLWEILLKEMHWNCAYVLHVLISIVAYIYNVSFFSR